MMTRIAVVSAALPALLVLSAAAQELSYDVPFVPTRDEVVDVMLSMADVKKDDVLYDLGCGDGRIVINAAVRYGARGVGVDINPERIRESNENAVRAKVTDRVRFVEGNLFEADFREATVLALYLLPSVNLKLRPQILRQLRPGARVVSHNYAMGSWEADDSREVTTNYTDHQVFFWVVPANVSGVWTVTVTGKRWKEEYTLTLDQAFQKAEGTAVSNSGKVPVGAFRLVGGAVAFTLGSAGTGEAYPMQFSGLADGDAMEGTVAIPGGARKGTFPWKAVRTQGTAKPIDAGAED